MGGDKEGYGWGSWWISTFLLTLGVVSALVGIAFGVVGGLVNPDQPGSQTLASGGLTIAVAALALIAAGGVLRWCSYCCDDCDWDEGEELVQIQGTKTGKA